jgi:hypothetical protein
MSETQRHHDDTRTATATATDREGSPYASDRDWWYDNPSERDESDGGHDELPGTTRAEYVAHGILKQGADLLDPITLNSPPDRGVAPLFEFLFDLPSGGPSDPSALHEETTEVAVSDPQVHVPKEHVEDSRRVDYNQFSKRWRVSEEHGYLCRGPVIADRPTDEFMEVVGAVLHTVQHHTDREFAPGEREAIRERALRQKTDPGGPHDTTIMEDVVRCIDTPNRVSSNSEQ